jgi:hypothetical protein
MPKLKVQPAEIEVAEIQGVELKAAAVAAIDDTTIDVEGIDVVGAEIDLQPVGEETTQFSDSEEIPVEHINFEFEQNHKLQGILRQLSVFQAASRAQIE